MSPTLGPSIVETAEPSISQLLWCKSYFSYLLDVLVDLSHQKTFGTQIYKDLGEQGKVCRCSEPDRVHPNDAYPLALKRSKPKPCSVNFLDAELGEATT